MTRLPHMPMNDIILSNYDDHTEGKYYDMLILIGKWVILQSKLACCNPTIEYFHKRLVEIQSIEQKLAEHNNRYFLKWGFLWV